MFQMNNYAINIYVINNFTITCYIKSYFNMLHDEMEVVKMETEIKLRGWIDLFNEGKFDDIDVKVQIDAGWYDWFCKDTSLKNKTKKMGNIIKQIKDGGKVNLDETYVWFKTIVRLLILYMMILE